MEGRMPQPLVTIVIPVFRGAEYLGEAIESALGQTWTNCEILVVNDGSDDDGATERVARSYGDRIRYIAKENGGVASALNEGIRQMKGEYFAWLSHDDLYAPQRIAHQMACLEQMRDRKTIIFGDYSNFTDEKEIETRVVGSKYTQEQLDTPLFAVFHRAVNGCTTLIHREHFARVGLFDEGKKTTQDYDMWFRLMRGQPVHFCAACDTRSRIHPNQGSRTMAGIHQLECEQLWRTLFDAVSAEEMARVSGTEEAFYQQMATAFTKETSYASTARMLRLRAAARVAQRLNAERGGHWEGLEGLVPQGGTVWVNEPRASQRAWRLMRRGQRFAVSGAVTGEVTQENVSLLLAVAKPKRVMLRLEADADFLLLRDCVEMGLCVTALLREEGACTSWLMYDILNQCANVVVDSAALAARMDLFCDRVFVAPGGADAKELERIACSERASDKRLEPGMLAFARQGLWEMKQLQAEREELQRVLQARMERPCVAGGRFGWLPEGIRAAVRRLRRS